VLKSDNHNTATLYKVKSLRIMHCETLTSLKGLDKLNGVGGKESQLNDLNISSNSIMTMSGLDNF